MDPFAGCGTVLVEAPVHPSHPMRPVGFEINPLARLIAKVKTTPLDRRAVQDAWRRLLGRYHRDSSRAGLSGFPNKRHWFTERVERRLARACRVVDALRDGDVRDFFTVALSSLVRDVSLADPSVSVPVLLDPSRYHDPAVRRRVQLAVQRKRDADVVGLLEKTVWKNLARIEAWSNSLAFPVRNAIRGGDARTLATSAYLGRGRVGPATNGTLAGVDLVLTSPPYANAQRYTRSLRLELFVLGYTSDSREERDLDRLQVGTERVPESEWEQMLMPTASPTGNRAISRVRRVDSYRAAVVGKYVRDMEAVVRRCSCALRPGGHAVFVVGNNCVRGGVLDNAGIMSELCRSAGLAKVLHLRNRIPNRGLLTKRHPTAGLITHEHVLMFRKPLASSRGEGQRVSS